MTRQVVFLILLSLSAGALRQWAPNGIAWWGHWPTSTTSAHNVYQMMAKEGDPSFISLTDTIQAHTEKSATFLDARAHQDYAKDHLPGARSLPFYEMDHYKETALKGLAANSFLVVYCEGIDCELSFFLGRALVKNGFTNVKIFYGGYPEWKNAGLPIEK